MNCWYCPVSLWKVYYVSVLNCIQKAGRRINGDAVKTLATYGILHCLKGTNLILRVNHILTTPYLTNRYVRKIDGLIIISIIFNIHNLICFHGEKSGFFKIKHFYTEYDPPCICNINTCTLH